MGLAASQARYLALTARRSDLEYQSQTINSRRIQLSYKTAEIAREYSDGMNNSRIKIAKSIVGENGKAQNTWEELTFSNLFSSGYMLIGSEGSALNPSPYLQKGNTIEEYAVADLSKFGTNNLPFKTCITADEYCKLEDTDANLQKFYKPSAYKTGADGKQEATEYTLINAFSSSDKSLTDEIKTILDGFKESDNKQLQAFASAYRPGRKIHYSFKENPDYVKNQGADIQSLLVSGQAQIVTKEFYEYLVSHGLYSPTTGFIPDNCENKSFYQIMEMFENDKQYNYAGRKSVVDWRSDETDTFESRTYTEDDEKVLAKYEADTAKIQALDKQLEMEEKNIETQHKAVETELENLKKVIQKNIEDTFKIFS